MARFNFGGSGAPAFTFDLGTDPVAGDILYNQGSWEQYFPQAWQQVVNQLGGQPGSNYARFLQNWAGNAKMAYKLAAMQQPGYALKVSDFLNQYAPGVGNIWQNQSAITRGENPLFAGLPRFLG